MAKRYEKKIVKRGTITAYAAVRLFPKSVRDDLTKLYSFIRIVDEYADASPADIESFKYIVRRWSEVKKSGDFGRHKALDKSIPEKVLANIVYLVHRFEIDPTWVDSYLKAMASDIKGKSYSTIRDTVGYMDGSAEVVALMAAKTMRLPNAAMHFAKMQGRALQFLHLIRDISEDNARGRCYFPSNELRKFGLTKLDEAQALKKPEDFQKFIQFQVKRYRLWQHEAEKGLEFVPRRLRTALKTTLDMYAWTARKIEKDPLVIFDRRVKPSNMRIAARAARRIIKP